MVSRHYLRIKTMQALYAYNANPKAQVRSYEADMVKAIHACYELFLWLFALLPEIAFYRMKKLESLKEKYHPTEEDLNPNMKFVNNRLVAAIASNEQLQQFAQDHTITWNDDPIFERLMLEKVINSDLYKDYMADSEDNMTADSLLWQQLMKHVILPDENMADAIEQRSLFWTEDDMDLMGQFVCKTFRRLAEGDDDAILPMFKDEEDGNFGKQLFSATVTQMAQNNTLIDELVHVSRWDKDRIVLMDRIIMCTALAELTTFDKIPTAVTMNEYIELAKNFSTAGSGQFVNGILNNAVKQLRHEGKLQKP